MIIPLPAALIGILVAHAGASVQSATPGQAADTAAFEDEPCPFMSAAESARYRVTCGTVSVPVADTGTRRYRIQVAILRSLEERLHNDAIVVLPGGPGEDFVRGNAARLAQHPLQDTLRQHRDIVLLDPRATGYSEPGELCPALQGMQVRAAVLRLSLDDRTALVRRELERCRAALLEQGIEPGHFNSVALARDLESLRKALGYAQLNLIGLSWGARVALETMRRYPATVRSAILYGPFAPDGSVPGVLAARAGPSLKRLFQACVTDPVCTAEFPDTEGRFTRLLDELDANPIPLDTPWGELSVDGSVAETAITYALYDSEFLRYVPLAISELSRRNAAFIRMLFPRVMGQGASGGFYYAAHCFELTPPLPADSVRRLRQRYPWTGRSDHFAPDPTVVCDAFVPPRGDSSVVQPVRSDVPAIIFAGEFDPTTPPEYGHRISATLSRSTLLVLRGRGHDVNVPTPCTTEIRRAFIDNPHQAPDTTCLVHSPPLTFATNVHVNPGVPRVVSSLVVARKPIWIAGAGLLSLLLLAGIVLLPVSALAFGRRAESRNPLLATAVLWVGAAVALSFSVALMLAITTAPDAYVSLFGVAEGWSWIFTLLPIVVALAASSVLILVIGWRRRWWSRGVGWLAGGTVLATVGIAVTAVRIGLL
jgi:pimeloyl-ACP methyl ester carboxylesterase